MASYLPHNTYQLLLMRGACLIRKEEYGVEGSSNNCRIYWTFRFSMNYILAIFGNYGKLSKSQEGGGGGDSFKFVAESCKTLTTRKNS